MSNMFAQSKGIGTTWIAGTMNRDAFEAATRLEEGERMPCVTPLGRPAARMALRESLMRKGVKAAAGKDPQLKIEDPGMVCPAGTEYIASVQLR